MVHSDLSSYLYGFIFSAYAILIEKESISYEERGREKIGLMPYNALVEKKKLGKTSQ